MPLQKTRGAVLPWTSLSLAACLLGTLVMAGCAKGGDQAGSATSGAPDPALIAAGKTVYASNNCTGCHSLDGQGGRRGPDLTHIGADPQHTPQWLSGYVKDPKSQNPSSRMPAFGSRIADKDLLSLGAYLASLK